jgi:hypothetical protein
LARSEVKVRQWRQKPLVAACGPLLAGGVRHTEVKPDYCQTHAEQAANGRISPLFGPHTHTFPATTKFHDNCLVSSSSLHQQQITQ